MNAPFVHIFKNYEPDPELRKTVDALGVEKLDGDRARRSIVAVCASEDFLDTDELRKIEDGVAACYGLACFKIRVRYPTHLLSDEYLAILCDQLKERHPVANGFFLGADFALRERTLEVCLKHDGVEFLTAAGLDRVLSDMIFDDFGIRITVLFGCGAEGNTETLEQALEAAPGRESSEEHPVVREASRVAAPKAERKDTDKSAFRRRSYTPKEGEELIFGKPLEEEITPIDRLDLNFVSVTIVGEVFAVNNRSLPERDLEIISFDVTDHYSSIRVSRPFKSDKAQPLLDGIHVGDRLMIQAQPVFNRFEGEMTLSPNAVVRVRKQKRQDTAEKKRVELHLHTNMSAMDGMSPAGALVERAAEWGHTAVAVTDHGVAQAFPDAAAASKKTGVKILYGVEGYDLNDCADAQTVFGRDPGDTELNGSFVVFDLETTGLSPRDEKITEIAAARVTGGEVTETFEQLINPGKPIPAKITELTGITDAMVADAPTIDEALPKFLDFIGEDILVAHNATFDAAFLTAALHACGLSRDYCYLDTLELSRAILPGLAKYNLKAVATAVGAGDFRHHRAGEDASVLASILTRLISRLRDAGVTRVGEINPYVGSLLRTAAEDHGELHHIILIAKNLVGLKNLYELISLSQIKHFKRRPRILRSELIKFREGLIIGSACEQGELFQAVYREKPWKQLVKMAEFYDYLEIQPIGNNEFMVRNGSVADNRALQDINRTIVRVGKAANRPVCATGDVHFLEPYDAQFRAILMAGQGFTDADQQAPLYFKSTDEMLEEFSYLGEKTAYEVVVENTNKIADLCEKIKPVPDGVFPPSIPGSAEELQEIVYRRAKEVYGDPLPQIVSDRIEAELAPIIRHGFDVMYMIAQKLIAKSNAAGFLVGSRGSVGSSIVAYFANITEVNALPPHYRCEHCLHSDFDVPTGYSFGIDMPDRRCPVCGNTYRKDGCDIMFATFLGFDADKQPDIDLNFSGEYQASAHRDTIELFGADHVFRAGTIGTLAEKTAYGFVRKYMEERGKTVSKVELDRLTLGCTGVRRTTGQHPGGLVVIPKEYSVYDFCPVQHPADDPDSDIITTHFDFHSIHDTVLKLDLLGHDDPTMIKMLGDLTGIDMLRIPFDDRDTMSLFLSSKVLGYENDPLIGPTGCVAIPEFGTKFVRGMLMETKPTTFAGLVRISGLSHGTDVWLGNAQKIIAEGKSDLNGVICCRDDVTAYLIGCGIPSKLSFKISETVRKGKGLMPDWVPMMREHNVPEWYIESANTVKYLFPRAHATAYVMMAFRIAWCKVHEPMAFYAAYYTIRATGFDPLTAVRGIDAIREKYYDISDRIDRREPVTPAEKDTMQNLEVCYEMYLRGFSFLRPDIYRSDAARFLIEGNALRIPFAAIGGFGQQAAQDIVTERERGRFSSVEDLAMRCPKVSKSVIALLEEHGVLEDMPKTEQLTMF
ncbi:MAG: PolC-type DNA polymerase III [Clostridiaceae bacterium]|nr:PolC-type DNA polymerase III [Clostridiaceae bacterium]